MVQFTDALVFALLSATARAAPLLLNKRIAQTTIDSVTPWEDACNSAGGGQQCNPIAVTAASTLLAAAGNCDQQDSADAMISLAKTLNNDANMISLAQIFAQQPRNSPNSLAVPYCDTAPQNSELNGFFQCQFQGSDQTSFVGGLSVGQAGTIPLGLSAAVSPAGSCPANPNGPVADGQQLNAITQNPGTPSSSGSTASGSTSVSSGSTASSAAPAPASSSASTSDNSGAGAAAGDSASSASSSTSTAGTTTSSTTSSTSGFALSNGQAAQSQNAQFASLTAGSSCTDGQNACVNGAFAQCVGGKFETTQCGSGETCAALPLVNSAGTSITCTTTADAEARIAATGATGGLTGDGSTTSASSASSDTSASAAVSSSTAAAPSTSATASDNQAATSSSSTSSFALSNGQAAQKLNAQFATLSASSTCTDGENACVNGAFAQCVSGKFETTACAGGTTCAALPLVNSAGTSITCATTADAEARIAATGATGGLTGSS
ncbi:hypothetical protein GGU10DRAFT_304339 [Lentinula aff. detonsa]|uniref:Carbohydrate-binding module family 19 domain-containing protein n=1 Tax=Lentinula aff. detonsa TaxID=2804958 RepID=A0AA38NRI8_9AGAR|nr:hypothetical protein GGU10DRAFT_304339 [Lentinula aff. detonsa]